MKKADDEFLTVRETQVIQDFTVRKLKVPETSHQSKACYEMTEVEKH